MKAIELYVCEICGKHYAKEQDAVNCENKHITLDNSDIKFLFHPNSLQPFAVQIKYKDYIWQYDLLKD